MSDEQDFDQLIENGEEDNAGAPSKPKPTLQDILQLMNTVLRLEKMTTGLKNQMGAFDWTQVVQDLKQEKVETEKEKLIENGDDPNAAKYVDPKIQNLIKKYGSGNAKMQEKAVKAQTNRKDFRMEVYRVISNGTGYFADIFDPVEELYSSVPIDASDYLDFQSSLLNGEKVFIELSFKEFKQLSFTPSDIETEN